MARFEPPRNTGNGPCVPGATNAPSWTLLYLAVTVPPNQPGSTTIAALACPRMSASLVSSESAGALETAFTKLNQLVSPCCDSGLDRLPLHLVPSDLAIEPPVS